MEDEDGEARGPEGIRAERESRPGPVCRAWTEVAPAALNAAAAIAQLLRTWMTMGHH